MVSVTFVCATRGPSCLQVCVAQPVLAHYQLTSRALRLLMTGELGLLQLCAHLRCAHDE